MYHKLDIPQRQKREDIKKLGGEKEEKMETRKLLVGMLVSAMLFSSAGLVVAYDSSNPYSNFVEWTIADDTAFSVSVGGGASKVVFAPTSKTENNTEPTGQSDGTPIFTVTNAGNIDLDFKCNLTSAKPTWATIKVNDEYNNVTADTFDTALQTFNTSVSAGDHTAMYLWTNVTDAPGGSGADATHNRTLRIYSVAS